MFEEQIKASFAAWCVEHVRVVNKGLADNYIGACQNWAIRETGPAPVAPMAFDAIIDLEGQMSFQMVQTDKPVSSVKPQDFIPRYGTDTNAVGGPVGGPIPNLPGKFYLASGVPSPNVGDVYPAVNPTHKYTRPPMSFIGYWEAIS